LQLPVSNWQLKLLGERVKRMLHAYNPMSLIYCLLRLRRFCDY